MYRGVLVSFNSDSSELARYLYLEAAKAVKFGETSEIEALKFVTLNPAKQFGIEKTLAHSNRVKTRTRESGPKHHFDWNCLLKRGWMAKKYFDRALDGERTKKLEKERADLARQGEENLEGWRRRR